MPAQSDVAAKMMPNGPGAAAVLAAGIGAFALGSIAVATDKLPYVAGALIFYRPTGPLSGVSTMAILLWLGAWALLHHRWRRRDVELRRIVTISLVMLAVGILLTFPPFADLF